MFHRLIATCAIYLLTLMLITLWLALPQVSTAAEQAYSGNAKTMLYHNSKCRYFACKTCTIRFGSIKEATSKGYKACKVCGG